VHTINVGSGKSSQGNLPSADGVGGQNIAARNARRVHGSSTDIGVSLPLNKITSHTVPDSLELGEQLDLA